MVFFVQGIWYAFPAHLDLLHITVLALYTIKSLPATIERIQSLIFVFTT